ncbi:endonuclease [Terrihabitans soli]|uniref:Endonuclease n=1 Tax=Terrihabitans soli TaxID=708113 RepID=A0A6S6QWM2_9HYPH|nr:endonuclease/exonuclease/phosphatase family protein [Terrihabitans soli]BCJ91965.1 endonuclease [Terrihabitans soli]
MNVRVLTWNIQGGRIGKAGRSDLAPVVGLIRRWEPDIVALQEVDSRRCAPGDAPAFTFITQQLGFHAVEAKTIIAKDGGEYGQMLSSRWALARTEVHDISVPHREPRRAIEAEIDTPAGRVLVFASHFGLTFGERRKQAETVARLAAKSRHPAIVLGDFNDWTRHGAVQKALSGGFPALTQHRTWPSFFPVMRLDRVFCRPASALRNSRTDPEGARFSDHLPIIADINLAV